MSNWRVLRISSNATAAVVARTSRALGFSFLRMASR
jgi:hypothetical protein